MLYRITVKQSKLTSGIRLERGMSVDVISNSMSNPVTTERNFFSTSPGI